MRTEEQTGAALTPAVGALLLAGGAGRRMGRDKGSLPFGPGDFLSTISGELSGFEERLLSVSAPREPLPGFRQVADLRPGCGPLGGICAGLGACRSPYLLVVACDMPLFQVGLARYLAAFLTGGYDAYVPVDRGGRVHPLCAIYGKTALPHLEERLRQGRYRMMEALEGLRVKYVPLEHSAYPDEIVTNVNTGQEYRALLRRREQPPVLAVCGEKNAGKTTFLCGLIPALNRLGLRVAAIKHDGHEFEPDRPGTDSFRLLQAGAWGAAVYSHSQCQLVCRRAGLEVPQLARAFAGADLVLLEGGRQSRYPKIEVVRPPISLRPTASRETLLAVCAPVEGDWGVLRLGLEDYAGAARLIADWLAAGRE